MTSVLFARRDSIYKELCKDVWDEERDARKYSGTDPVVAHPPCRMWGRMRQFAKGTQEEKNLAIFAINCVRKNGGVLEHPAFSSLWKETDLPSPKEGQDSYGGYTIQVEQHDFGHRAEKKTWLYIVGINKEGLPYIPKATAPPTHCIRPGKSYPRLPSVTKPEREHTPKQFAVWLLEVCDRISKNR